MPFPRAIDTILRTSIGWLVIPTVVVIGSLAAIGMALCGASMERLHRTVYARVARISLWVGGTRLEVRGSERIRSGQAYVVVTNHESNWDSFCIIAALPDVILRFVAKKQIMRIPIFGDALRLTGNVQVDRGPTREDVGRIQAGMRCRDPRVSILFYAEGQRSMDGRLQSFKKGPFATALGAGLPILPVAIAGTYEIMAKRSAILSRGDVVVQVGEPIGIEGLTFEDRAALRDRAHAVIADLRAEAHAELGRRDAEADATGSTPGRAR